MVRTSHRFALLFYRDGGEGSAGSAGSRFLGQVAIEPDFGPAVECCRFRAIRRGLLSPDGRPITAAAEPVWHPTTGRPCMAALRVRIDEEGGGQADCELPTSYFKGLARQASLGFVESGVLKSGELFRYLVAAYPRADSGGDPGGNGPAAPARASAPALALTDAVLADYTRTATWFGPTAGGAAEDVPVFIPRVILAEAAALTRQAGSLETGGFLIGHIRRDISVPEIFVEVTALIPAKHSRSELTKLTFTADTWTAAAAAVELRHRNEIMLGWFHSHSFMKETCKDCPSRKDGTCSTTATFMSDEDCAVQRTCFFRAYSIALVVADSPCAGLNWALFGWRLGMIDARGFGVLPEAADAAHIEQARQQVPAIVEGDADAKA